MRISLPSAGRATTALALALAVAACAETTSEPSAADALDLSAAFNSLPAGYEEAATSYAGGPPMAGLWIANARGDRLGMGALMGGGLRDEFVGGMPFPFAGGRGPGGAGGPFGGALRCQGNVAPTFSATTGRVSCPAETVRGLTITRSAAYATTAGAVQQAFDTATTNSVTLRTTVAGTLTFDGANGRGHGGFGFGHHGGRGPKGGGRGPLLGDTATITAATTQVQSASERTTSGLAAGSTQRTVNAASASSETTSGTSSRGAFTATRAAGDTTRGLVVPVRTATNANPYPTAGTVIRVMRATVTFAGQAPITATRREVVTYDGSATARIVVTKDGTTQTCTRALPRGPLTCS